MLTRCPFSPELRGKRGFAFAACKALVRFTSWIVNADRANSSLDRGDSSQALRRHRARHFMADGRTSASGMKWSCSQAAIRELRPTWNHVGRRHCVWTARSATQMHCTSPCSSEFANGLTISICCTFISITIRSPCFPVSPHHL